MPINKWIDQQMWYIYKRENYSAIERMNYWYTWHGWIPYHYTAWKPDQKEKVHTVWFHSHEILENAKYSIMTKSRLVVSMGWGWRG